MSKTPAKPEEIDRIKSKIIEESISLINEIGFSNFSMRKLGSRLGIAAKTIYNYFSDKDELYLQVLVRGFYILHKKMEEASLLHKDPYKQLYAMAHAYIRFGLENSHYYNVLFSLDLPRFRDYVGTEHEELAYFQNQSAIKIAELTGGIIDKIRKKKSSKGKKNTGYLLLQLWSRLHGIVSLSNNRITLEVGDFKSVLNQMVDDAVLDLK
ncbi:TetR/AcrR family transcriptional regulator [Leptospira sarikeiensis]|uniref:TetR/AcrR family transcriptional regulator n=1 Tax=Leptospira sarikeiensis TaxID=2484943 RepID=A0A4V3JS33_9LEPT|nr:TetR/AcrR family transcriptional regulator [Leptospira sarikeiensis]TGL62071.1 TetR/AcrR family transcriptional regulator [Leptospira sarikeiensis]